MSKRTTVTLDERDEQTLAAFTDPESAEWKALVTVAATLGITVRPGSSEATIIRALLQAGAKAVQEQALERGYAQLAEIWDEAHDAAEARVRRRRYAERVDRVMPG
jgi:hypothetical protein